MEAKQQKGWDHGRAGPGSWAPQCLGCTRGVTLPGPGAAGTPVCSQHAPGPRPTLGCVPSCHWLSASASNPPARIWGAPALPAYRLRWSVHAGTGHLVSLAAALAGLGRGAEQHRPAVQKREYSWEKLWWEGASRPVGPQTQRTGALQPTPSPATCPEAGGALWWRHNLEFAVPPSLLRSHSPVILAVLGFHSKQRAAVRLCPCCVFQGIQTKVVIQMW